jgi:hypothetical protein
MATPACPFQSQSNKGELHRILNYSGFSVLTSVRCFGPTSHATNTRPKFWHWFCEAATHRVLFNAPERTMPACLAENEP